MRTMTCLLLVASLAACAGSSGGTASKFVKGQTTEGEVLAQLGPPTNSMTLPNLQKVDVFGPDSSFLQDVPVVLFLAPPPSVTAYQFDKDNVLVAMASDASPDVINTGLTGEK